MDKAPTFKQVCRLVKILSVSSDTLTMEDGFKNDGQREAARVLCENSQIIYQAHRRSGKSYIVSIIAAIYILKGQMVIIGSPTLSQSSRILLKEIVGIMDTLIDLIGGLKKVDEAAQYTSWSNKGSVLAVTANTKSHQQEGYGAAMLIIDEGHRIDPEILSVIAPSIDDAVEIGIGKKVILGVGGHKSRLIETQKGMDGWARYKYPASANTRPGRQAVFQEAKAGLPDVEYKQHYECEPVSEGTKVCYPNIPGRVDTAEALSKGQRTIHLFGIDVGKKDENVTIVMERVGNIYNVIDSFAISHPDHRVQAKLTAKFIDKYVWRPDRIVIEHNNAGTYFQDTMRTYNVEARTQVTTEDFKDSMWHSSYKAITEGRLGVEDPVVREHLQNMTYDIKSNGHYEFAHDDYFSAFTMVWSMCG